MINKYLLNILIIVVIMPVLELKQKFYFSVSVYYSGMTYNIWNFFPAIVFNCHVLFSIGKYLELLICLIGTQTHLNNKITLVLIALPIGIVKVLLFTQTSINED